MRQNTFGKLVGTWFLLMLPLPLALLVLAPDLAPGRFSAAMWKLCILFALLSAASVASTYVLARSWALPTRRFEDFVAALPGAGAELPVAGPPELQSLSRAMRAMAERVRHVVERANLEFARRETILAGMAEGVLAVDKNLKVIFCNHAFAEHFTIRMPLLEGRTLYEVVREPVLRDVLERVVRSGALETHRFQLPSAAGRWFEARALPLGDAPAQGAVIVFHDITTIQRQEQLRKDFVADVSHELRTPLASIRGYAETLLSGALDDQENNRKFVEIILSHAVRLNNIASDLLVLSELDSDTPSAIPPERISVHEVIEAAMRTVESGAALRNVSIHYDQCQELWVVGYRFRLEQALVNLLDNAVKFNRPDGTVSVECCKANDGLVRISVNDTGIGIPSDDIQKVFERFYRVDKARSRPAGGTGLGLPIVKEVVERMGGSVQVESQLGRGSKFTISLKAA